MPKEDSVSKIFLAGTYFFFFNLTLQDEKFISSLNPAKATNPAGSKILQRWLGEPNFTLYPSDNADAKGYPHQGYTE